MRDALLSVTLLALLYAGLAGVFPPDPPPAAKGPPAPRPVIGAKVGGPVSPDGSEEVQCELPGELHRKNTSSKGLGLCVFTSIHHSALWQNEPVLQEFPKWLVDKRIEGGGYPEKVQKLIPQIAKDRGLPEPEFVQIEGEDLEMLKLACKTGRMPAVTYSRSPTGRYGGQKIAHMVSLPGATDKWFTVLDNNYVGADALEWMTPKEFKKTYAMGGSGWSVILLSPGPPAPPRNP